MSAGYQEHFQMESFLPVLFYALSHSPVVCFPSLKRHLEAWTPNNTFKLVKQLPVPMQEIRDYFLKAGSSLYTAC